MPFPEDQKENVLRPASVSHATIWDMADQKASQSAPVAQKSKNVLPTTPLIDCRSAKGTPYKCAPPYTLVVPIPPTTALNMRTPEHAWSHGLFLALHALKLAFENMTGGEPLSLAESAEHLDTYRRIYCASSTAPARHYLANCRVLHGLEAYGPTTVAGRRKFDTGEPYARAKNNLILGDSGAHIYSPTGKKHHSVVKGIRTHAGSPNIHDFTEIGGPPLAVVADAH